MINSILIIDDDNYKKKNIKELVLSIDKTFIISEEEAINPGLLDLRSSKYDLIILDMSLPVFSSSESSSFNPFGGIAILKEMRRKEITTPVIVVTQYEIFGEGEIQKTSKMIDEECKSKFDNYIGIVIYSSVNNEWKEKLVKMIGDIKNDNNTVC